MEDNNCQKVTSRLIGNKYNPLVKPGKASLDINVCKLGQVKIYEWIVKIIAAIGNQYLTSPYQYIIVLFK